MTKRGNILIILLAIVAIILSAIWFFTTGGGSLPGLLKPTPTPDSLTRQLMIQGTSDETIAIEADIEATSFESLDAELSGIEAELNAQ